MMKNRLNSQFSLSFFHVCRRRYLIICLFCLLTISKGFTQSLVTIPCDKLAVEVFPTEAPACSGSNKCGKLYYQVRLTTHNGFSNVNNVFKLRYHVLTVPVVLDISNPATGGLSRVNTAITQSCYNQSGFSGFPLSIEPVNGGEQVTFYLLNEGEGPSVVFTKVIVGGNQIWRSDLFVVAIDAFAGETMSLTALNPLYRNLPPGQTGAFNCNLSNASSANNDPVTVVAPSEMESNVCLQFGAYNTTTKLLPVQLTNNNLSATALNQLMFSFTITANNLMEQPVVLNVPANMTCLLVSIPGTMNWQGRVFYNPSSGSINLPVGATTTLFNIRLVGPVNTSLAASAQFCFGSQGVIRTTVGGSGGSDCKKVCTGSCTTVGFPGSDPCSPNDFTFRITSLTPSIGNCENLQASVQLFWNEKLPAELFFDQIKFTVAFDMASGVSISGIGANTIGCPANPQCLPAGGFSNCFKIDGNKVSFCFFPVTAQPVTNGASFIVDFSAIEGCVSGAVVTESMIDISGSGACVPNVVVEEDFALCPPRLSGSILDELGYPAPNCHVDVVHPSCSSNNVPVTDGLFSECVCPQASGYTIKPVAANNDWLNGVTTFDLVLISKHILQLELLNSPYKIIAADANNSTTITGLDIVDIRKLILGITVSFPAPTNSWRYIKSDFVFPNPLDPFLTAFPDNWAGSPPNDAINFLAVKIGDVNNTHTAGGGTGMARIGSLPVGIGNPSQRADEFMTVPVSYEGAEAIAAMQLGLQFDAAQWELVEPSTAGLDEFTLDCFNLAEADAGKIKFLWFTPLPKKQLQPGQVLFYLTFHRKPGTTDAPLNLRTDDSILENAGFKDSGSAYNLVSTVLGEERTHLAPALALNWSVVCTPNPVTDAATLRIQNPEQRTMSVWVFNALGVRTYYREILAPAGATEVTIPEVANWPSGIYTWKVKSGKDKLQGQFIRR